MFSPASSELLLVFMTMAAATKGATLSLPVSSCNFRKLPDPAYNNELRWFPDQSDNCRRLKLLKSGCSSYKANFYKHPRGDTCIPDITPPTATFQDCPVDDITVLDPAITYTIPTAFDADTGELLHVSCSPTPEANFTENITVVACRASNSAGNTAQQECSFDVKLACREPLGMQSGVIPDNSLSASSSDKPGYYPKQGRLNINAAWCTMNLNLDQWFRIDLQAPTTVTGLITQGRHFSDVWLTSFKVQYGNDGTNWNDVTGPEGTAIEFQANVDHETHVTNYFPAVLTTRFIQIRPVAWQRYICIRLELLGCRGD